jgi:hypothetical protein
MVTTYWKIGEKIVELQGGEKRASYGNEILKTVSVRLTEQFEKGFSYENLTNM